MFLLHIFSLHTRCCLVIFRPISPIFQVLLFVILCRLVVSFMHILCSNRRVFISTARLGLHVVRIVFIIVFVFIIVLIVVGRVSVVGESFRFITSWCLEGPRGGILHRIVILARSLSASADIRGRVVLLNISSGRGGLIFLAIERERTAEFARGCTWVSSNRILFRK